MVKLLCSNTIDVCFLLADGLLEAFARIEQAEGVLSTLHSSISHIDEQLGI